MEKTSEIYLAGGCFWGTEHFLKQIRGVEHTEVGYANGNTANPTYKEVCTDKTGFAETVKRSVLSCYSTFIFKQLTLPASIGRGTIKALNTVPAFITPIRLI